MAIDVDRVLDARPAWVDRARDRTRARLTATPARRRLALAGVIVVWQVGDWLLPRRLVVPVGWAMAAMVALDSVATWVWVSTGLAVEGNPLVAQVMTVFGDGLGLGLRAVWSWALIAALTWIALRRPAVRPAMLLAFIPLAAVTLIHALALGLLWSVVLGVF